MAAKKPEAAPVENAETATPIEPAEPTGANDQWQDIQTRLAALESKTGPATTGEPPTRHRRSTDNPQRRSTDRSRRMTDSRQEPATTAPEPPSNPNSPASDVGGDQNPTQEKHRRAWV